MTRPARPTVPFFAALAMLARKARLARIITTLLVALTILSVLATYAALTGFWPFTTDLDPGTWLANLDTILLVDLAIAAGLGLVVLGRIVAIAIERRRGQAGARLHARLVMLFGAVAVLPTVSIALFAALFIDLGIQGWFSGIVSGALDNSRSIAEAYLHEHEQTVRADVTAMAGDLTRDPEFRYGPRNVVATIVDQQRDLRRLNGVIIFSTNSGAVIARSGDSASLEFDPVPGTAIDEARSGRVALLTSDRGDQVRALIELDPKTHTFLYVGRTVDPRIVAYVEQTRRAVSTYRSVEGKHSDLEITFSKIFGILAVMLLLAAIRIGLGVATMLTRPIAMLIGAAERIRAGDLATRVLEERAPDELGSLNRAFNRMASQLEAQRAELIQANLQLDLRRRFTETVLAGVSAGVIGLDRTGRIHLPNRTASVLTGVDLEARIGDPLAELIPEFAELIDAAQRRPDRRVEAQIRLIRDRKPMILLTRVTAEQVESETLGFVVTCDDVTELVTAQRTAAWADVARRIAHEIKNPLTPIQLSAERLKRRYLREISSDPETFTLCTDTIVRQVGDIGRMVDEFSAFARMPAPVLRDEDVSAIARETVLLMRNGNPSVRFELDLPDHRLFARCDARQIRQALINLVQNAVDAVEGRPSEPPPPPGLVQVSVFLDASGLAIEVEDNGKGLPVEGRERLTEPYMTTRAKGTGLGLAIVKKIMEDHAGELSLTDAPNGGARVRLTLPEATTGSGDTIKALMTSSTASPAHGS